MYETNYLNTDTSATVHAYEPKVEVFKPNPFFTNQRNRQNLYSNNQNNKREIRSPNYYEPIQESKVISVKKIDNSGLRKITMNTRLNSGAVIINNTLYPSSIRKGYSPNGSQVRRIPIDSTYNDPVSNQNNKTYENITYDSTTFNNTTYNNSRYNTTYNNTTYNNSRYNNTTYNYTTNNISTINNNSNNNGTSNEEFSWANRKKWRPSENEETSKQVNDYYKPACQTLKSEPRHPRRGSVPTTYDSRRRGYVPENRPIEYNKNNPPSQNNLIIRKIEPDNKNNNYRTYNTNTYIDTYNKNNNNNPNNTFSNSNKNTYENNRYFHNNFIYNSNDNNNNYKTNNPNSSSYTKTNTSNPNINNKIDQQQPFNVYKPIPRGSLGTPYKNYPNNNKIYVSAPRSSYNPISIKRFFYVTNQRVQSQAGINELGQVKTNQDSPLTITRINGLEDFNVFGVLDGHGYEGHFVSQWGVKFITRKITSHPELSSLRNPEEIYQRIKKNNFSLIHSLFHEADAEIQKEKFDFYSSGCTCDIVFQIGSHIICANVGDSRAIFIEGDKIISLSTDHKPNLPEEERRILEKGGIVVREVIENEYVGPWRMYVKGETYPGLSMSRCIGDLEGKPYGLSCEPEIKEYHLTDKEGYLIVCSDGIWDFMDNELVKKIGDQFYAVNNPSRYCDMLIKMATTAWANSFIVRDDITTVVAFFKGR